MRVEENMAWSNKKATIINLLEDGMFELMYVMGYLEGRAEEHDDIMASRCAEKLNGIFDRWKGLRSGDLEQGEFFKGEHGGEGQDQESVG